MTRVLLLLSFLAGCDLGPAIYVDRDGDGEGEVTSVPSGLHCGDDCAMIVYGPITLVATTPADSAFAGWNVDGCDGPTCTLQLTGDRHLVARFDAVFHTVRVTHSEGGTIVGTGIDCGTTCEASFRHGTLLDLGARPVSGYEFAGWSGACAGVGTCGGPVEESLEIAATFRLKPAVHVIKIGQGTVTSEPLAGINCGPVCTVSFPPNQSIVLRPTPAPGWAFAGWTGPCDDWPMGCHLTTGTDQTVTATFCIEGSCP